MKSRSTLVFRLLGGMWAITCLTFCSVTPPAPDDCCPTGCGSATDQDCPEECGTGIEALRSAMRTTLDQAATNLSITTVPNFTVLLRANDGKSFTHSVGSSTPTTSYASASTAKLVTAVTILTLVDAGHLSLSAKVSDILDFWTAESAATLRDLLSFTSGFADESGCAHSQDSCIAACLYQANADFADCVEGIYDENAALSRATPGADFYYSSSHLQVAGLMAMVASGAESWSSVFAAFQQQTGLFANSTYDFRSTTNPLLAGGMTWTGSDYLEFLWALHSNTRPKDGMQLLDPATWAALFADQRGNATASYSPVWEGLSEDWAYGLGNWLECPTATASAGSFNCGAGHRNSSPGAFGAYPFIDFDFGYVGIVARKSDAAGTFREGVRTFRQIQDNAEAWASTECAP